jgi:ubiquinone/menaquinone biosynthesis C-methylase UbiE
MSMEGALANWYAKITAKDLDEFTRLAGELTKDIPKNGRILEIAPGPGYLSVAMAKLGPYKVTALDISQSFVRMASEYAEKEGVPVHCIHGSASNIPLEDCFFDLIVCRAAFKNFSEPLRALNEMHRVLKPGAKAVIIDLRKDIPWDEIASYVDRMGLSKLNTWITKMTFKHMLLKRAYTKEAMESLVEKSSFKTSEIAAAPVGMEVRLIRRQPCQQQAA